MDKQKPFAQNRIPAKPNSEETGIPERKSFGQRFLNTCLAVILTIFCGCVALVIISQVAALRATRGEIASLQGPEIIEFVSVPVPQAEFIAQPHISEFDTSMREINPDYICWLKIDDTEISYPVVRGDDNEAYLGLSFYGESNYFGSLFMDYRCMGESVPNIIIYGHNSRQGDMFGRLRNYLNEDFLANHPVITLVANDKSVEYEIFSARRTNVNDPAYFLDFSDSGAFNGFIERCGAPSNATQILTLSTCVSGNDEDERVIVQGALR